MSRRRKSVWSCEQLEDRNLLATDLLGALNPTQGSSNPRDFAVAGNTIYFTADTVEGQPEIWATDGTPQGTRPLGIMGDLGATLGHQESFYFVAGSTLYATVDTGQIHATTDALQVVSTNQLISYMDEVYFIADDLDRSRQPTQLGFELMKTNGQPNSATLVSPVANAGSNGVGELYGVWDDLIYYAVGSRQSRLFGLVADGTFEGTIGQSSLRSFEYGANVGDYIVGSFSGRFGTVDVLNGMSRSDVTSARGSTGWTATAAGTYFIANFGELWFTEGTVQRTQRVDALQESLTGTVTELEWDGERLWMATENGLWTYDPAADEVAIVSNVGVAFGPKELTVIGEHLYFTADTGGSRTLGRIHTSTLATDFNISQGVSDPIGMVEFGDSIVFAGYHPEVGREVWIVDPETSDLQLLGDLNTQQTLSHEVSINAFHEFGDISLFVFDDGRQGSELWKTDGTAAGTRIVKDFRQGPGSSAPDRFLRVDDFFYFVANGDSGLEVWRTDGTSENTVSLTDFLPRNAIQSELVQWQDEIFFFADDGIHGIELWKTDGQSASLVSDAKEGPEGWGVDLFAAPRSGPTFYAEGQIWRWNGEQVEQRYSENQIQGTPIQLLSFGDDVLLVNSFRGVSRFNSTQNSFFLDFQLDRDLPTAIQLSDREVVITSRGRTLVFDERGGERELVADDSVFVRHAGAAVYVWAFSNRVGQQSFYDLYAYHRGDFEATLVQRSLPMQNSYAGSDHLVYELAADEGTGVELFAVGPDKIVVPLGGFEQSPTAVGAASGQLLLSFQNSTDGLIAIDLLNLASPDAQTIDDLFVAVRQGDFSTRLDFDRNRKVESADVDYVFDTLLDTNRADFDLDGEVTFADFLTLASNFGKIEQAWSQGDADGDGEVGFADFLMLAEAFGT